MTKSSGVDKKGGSRRGTTMADVAARAGVAVNTVSLTLREGHRVSPATREQVWAAIREMDYIPNGMAGALAAKRTNIVAVVLPTMKTAIFSDLVDGLASGLDVEGYQLLIGNSRYSAQEEEKIVESFLSYRPAAMVLVGLSHTERVQRLLKANQIPVVETISIGEEFIDCCIGVPHFRVMYDLTEYLIAKGYRRIAYVHSNWVESDRRNARRDGFEAAMRDRDCEVTIVLEWEFTPDTGARSLDEIRASRPDTDAVIYSSDPLAISGLLRAQSLGLDVPSTIAIVGVDNSALGALIGPGLTSMEIDYGAVGKRAAEVLLSRIRGDTVRGGNCINIGFSLAERGSA